MRLQKKSLSKVSLMDLLRRRRTNLTKFLRETGIVTYDLLVKRCNSIGVLPPAEEQFLKVKGNPVTHEFSSPTEGIIVLNPVEEEITSIENEDEISDIEDETKEIKKLRKKRKKED
jgi:hypothetical protein